MEERGGKERKMEGIEEGQKGRGQKGEEYGGKETKGRRGRVRNEKRRKGRKGEERGEKGGN